MKNLLRKLFPSKKEKDLRELQPIVEQINTEYAKLHDISDDELRGKTAEFKQRIQEFTAEVVKEIEDLRTKAENEADIHVKDQLFEQIDGLEKQHYEQLDDILLELMPEAFAVVKETARRLTENKQLVVSATDMDRELAQAGKDFLTINGDQATWKNHWSAAEAEIEWKMVHYDVQLIGGSVLHTGKIAEMATGEGKTLVATLPVYLNALAGMGVHVVTVNNYLAMRDCEWNGPVFQFHGLSVDCIDRHQPNSDERRRAYACDITYGTNNEFGFDYLRDNMTTHPEFLVQKRHFFAIVDEIDSVLIDEARTPLIISGPVQKDKSDQAQYKELKPRIQRLVRSQRQLVNQYLADAKKLIAAGDEEKGGLALFRAFKGLPNNSPLIKFLSETGTKAILNKTEGFYMQDNSKNMHEATDVLYFTIDAKNKQTELTDKGRDLLAQSGENPDLFVLPDIGSVFAEIENDTSLSADERLQRKDEASKDYADKSELLHSINQLLKAYTLFEKDVEYIVQEGKVMIVDEQTGRVLPGRRYSDGLHQAIEAKEDVKVEKATQTFASVTLQNYFRMYHKLAGMTGTAETEESEFYEIYKLDVVVIPTNRPIARDDREDLVFKTKREKYNAVIDEIVELQDKGQPVLVGTTSVDVSEKLSRMLTIRKVKHNVLNAKQHQREAEIVAEAGKPGAVTIATNMAGRGTDIKLGEGVKENGGLAIIGTERHESRRVDRQLRGRSGRQGDPGASQFYVSLEDDLMRLFGSDRISKVMDRMGHQDGEVIQHSWISKSISNAQRKVEENNFAMRKRLLEYDDVMNNQREVIYRRRRNALFGDRIKVDLDNMLFDFCKTLVDQHIDMTDEEGLKMDSLRFLGVDSGITAAQMNDQDVDTIAETLYRTAQDAYARKSKRLSETLAAGIGRIKSENPQIERILIPFSDGSKNLQIVVPVDKALESEGRHVVNELEKVSILSIIDDNWKGHLREMDQLRQSVQNAVFEQKDPLLVYKFESFQLFEQMLTRVNQNVLSLLFKADLHVENRQPNKQAEYKRDDFSKMKTGHSEVEQARRQQMDQERRVMAGPSGGEQQAERKMSRAERRAQERGKKKGGRR
ncbi:preprotein translocase subunit SecA [Pontibacter sp. G13]|uniref:preprotein translocase subunit SecA n=1 Tax=Pontibacter sp. G13 TaxID=3074898 RepID=UPI0028891757|nr:preprotein translocase subunit SecA [Pontibacter sp. G13]WNJ16276.1 preprotein translocase subunit SecA [Pontibacter sp. G13]